MYVNACEQADKEAVSDQSVEGPWNVRQIFGGTRFGMRMDKRG